MIRLALFFLVAALLPLLTSRASAQAEEAPAHDAEARALHEAGAAAFEDGRFEDALDRWRAAYALRSLPELLYNIGSAYDRLGRFEEALTNYRNYLAAVEVPRNENFVRRRIEILEGLQADSDEDEDEDAETTSRVGPILLTALGSAVLVSGVAVALRANGVWGDIDGQCDDERVCPPSVQPELDRLGRLVITADVLMIAGGAAALGGVLWLVLGGDEDDDEDALSLDIQLGPVSGATLRASF